MSKDEKMEARANAWDRYADQPIEFTVGGAFNAGFDAGYEAATAWREIKCDDDLPKKSGFYWVTQSNGKVVSAAFYVGAFDKDAIAWMPNVRPAPFVPKEGE
jgi:hypothetical protein